MMLRALDPYPIELFVPVSAIDIVTLLKQLQEYCKNTAIFRDEAVFYSIFQN